jgi:hypothetical protein
MIDQAIAELEHIIRKANRIAWAITPPPPKLARMYQSMHRDLVALHEALCAEQRAWADTVHAVASEPPEPPIELELEPEPEPAQPAPIKRSRRNAKFAANQIEESH